MTKSPATLERHKKKADKFYVEPGKVYIFTDGSCVAKTGAGGWGVTLYFNGHMKFAAGGAAGQTVNTMELTAILRGLSLVKGAHLPCEVVSDSRYALDAIFQYSAHWRRNNWRTASGLAVKNRSLIEAILDEKARFTTCYRRWVPGHAGVVYNEVADRLASLGRARHGSGPPGEIPHDELSADKFWAEGWLKDE